MSRFEGDCFEIIPTLEARYDLILTDPPYAMPATYYQGRNMKRRWSDTSIMSRWFAVWVETCLPVLKPRGTMAVFCDTISFAAFIPALYANFDNVFSLVWDKGSIGMGSPVRQQHELILVGFRRGGWVRDKATASVITCKRVASPARLHLAEKPVSLMQELVDLFCPPDGRVLDPFAGSGSTAAAARQAGRECDSIELDPADTGTTLFAAAAE